MGIVSPEGAVMIDTLDMDRQTLSLRDDELIGDAAVRQGDRCM
jgi:hypothetical protein